MKKKLDWLVFVGVIVFLITFFIISVIIQLNLWIYGGIITVASIAQILFLFRREIRKKLAGRS